MASDEAVERLLVDADVHENTEELRALAEQLPPHVSGAASKEKSRYTASATHDTLPAPGVLAPRILDVLSVLACLTAPRALIRGESEARDCRCTD
jgi:hypothetical protein